MTHQLNELLVDGIVSGAIRNLHFQDHKFSETIHQDLKMFIINPEESDDAQLKVIKQFDGTRLKMIVLLRGLIAGEVLAHSLYQKRWMVEYGGTSRSLLAVPYIAKGKLSYSFIVGMTKSITLLLDHEGPYNAI